MKISKLENELIEAISNNLPYSFIQVRSIYLKTNKSIDKTIFVLTRSLILGLLPEDLI